MNVHPVPHANANVAPALCMGAAPFERHSGMTLCPACLAIEVQQRGAPGHALLRITDTQRIKSSTGLAVTVSTFTCSTCHARWVYRDEKHVDNQGWSLEQ